MSGPVSADLQGEEALREQLFDLQSRVAFQEEALQVMSLQIAKQQDGLAAANLQIQHLHQKLVDLRDQLEQVAPGASDERPPHY